MDITGLEAHVWLDREAGCRGTADGTLVVRLWYVCGGRPGRDYSSGES